jgi:hypothetical protein
MQNWSTLGYVIEGWTALSCDHCEREVEMEDSEVTAIEMGFLDEPKCTCSASKEAGKVDIFSKEYYGKKYA